MNSFIVHVLPLSGENEILIVFKIVPERSWRCFGRCRKKDLISMN